MKTLFAAMAIVASLAFSSSLDAQQQSLVIQQPGPSVNPGPECECAQLGFHGHFIPGYGIKVESVYPQSKAAELGLEPGDVLKEINNVRINSEFQYRQLLRNAIRYDHGHIDILVRNIRYDWGHHVPKFVTVHTFLDVHYNEHDDHDRDHDDGHDH